MPSNYEILYTITLQPPNECDTLDIRVFFESKGGRQGYFRTDRQMEGNVAPIQILEGHVRPFSVI